ncbi:MAG TPA: leucyl aminopeptidase, partial [Actinomycetota bacterium]|nr:leucyl aminopeptidase [Actinomycetota bacterium]
MTTYAFSSASPASIQAGLLIVPMFEGGIGGPGVDELGVASAYAAAKLSGKKGETLLVPRRDGDGFAADAVLVVGAGTRDDADVTTIRRVLGRVGPTARRFGNVATTFASIASDADAADAVQATAEGLGLGAYRFDRLKTKTKPKDAGELKRVTVLGHPAWSAPEMKRAAARAGVIVDSVAWARDLVNLPSGDLPPAAIAREAQAMAKATGLTCKVWNETQLKAKGFGGILGVGQGSANPPRLIELTYRGAGTRTTPIALTGKGIAFDSGGLSIKDAAGMETMKDDMGGAASILATMRAIALLKPKLNVIAAIPCAENMPSGTAQKPGDVIRHYGGLTSEVLNTDAEGRLILADALALLAERKPRLIIDTATLTGACMIALGPDIAGAMGNDDALAREVIEAGAAVGEPIWQLPLFRDYRALLDSNVADVRNIGKRYGGAITAALFLSEFVGDTPWLHLDIAGPAFSENGTDLGPKGGTGVPV